MNEHHDLEARCRRCPTTIAIAISDGMASTTSVTRMISVSTQPPKMPAISPTTRPMPVANSAAATPTDSETRPA